LKLLKQGFTAERNPTLFRDDIHQVPISGLSFGSIRKAGTIVEAEQEKEMAPKDWGSGRVHLDQASKHLFIGIAEIRSRCP
jgi:hypothetical protein